MKLERDIYFSNERIEQMEMQFFNSTRHTKRMVMSIGKLKRLKMASEPWHTKRKYRYHDHVKLAHYADAAAILNMNFQGF